MLKSVRNGCELLARLLFLADSAQCGNAFKAFRNGIDFYGFL